MKNDPKLKNLIYHFIESQDDKQASPFEIVNKFMKIPSCSPKVSEQMTREILDGDSRFVLNFEGYWEINQNYELKMQSLADIKISLIYLVSANFGYRKDILKGIGLKTFYKGKIDELIVPIKSNMKIYYEDLIQMSFDKEMKPVSMDSIKSRINKMLEKSLTLTFTTSKIKMLLGRYNIFPETEYLSVFSILSAISDDYKTTNIERLMEIFSFPYRNIVHIRNILMFLEQLKDFIFDELAELGINSVEEVVELCESNVFRFDFSGREFNEIFLKKIPEQPGIYFFKDETGKIIYVGKSKNLNSRVNSYFKLPPNTSKKISRIHEECNQIEFKIFVTEAEAILEEYRAINKYNPEINIQKNVVLSEKKIKRKIPEKLIVLANDSEEGSINLILYNKEGCYSILKCLKSDREKIKEELNKHIFSDNIEKSPPDEFDLLQQWLMKNYDKLSVIDIYLTGTIENTIEIICNS
ncbi:MAG: nucleotide excision repair endonuclease [bacterium]|nr:nucleotide excision repair endonuclease [bacterium]